MTHARLLIGIAFAALIILLLVFGPKACTQIMDLKKEVRVQKGQAQAGIDSGAEATNTFSRNIGNAAAADATVKDGQDEIAKAPAGFSNDAADRAACRMRSFINTERCAALRAADTR